MKHDGGEGGEILHIVDGPEPRVVRPEEVDVIRQYGEVQRNCLGYQRRILGGNLC